MTWLTEYNITGINGTRYLIPQSQHLTCFSGGSFILGGVALEEPCCVDYGLELAQGCQQIYAETATKLGPNDWAWLDPSIDNSSGQVRRVPGDQAGFYGRAGFFVTGQTSSIGAEALESWYYGVPRHGRQAVARLRVGLLRLVSDVPGRRVWVLARPRRQRCYSAARGCPGQHDGPAESL